MEMPRLSSKVKCIDGKSLGYGFCYANFGEAHTRTRVEIAFITLSMVTISGSVKHCLEKHFLDHERDLFHNFKTSRSKTL